MRNILFTHCWWTTWPVSNHVPRTGPGTQYPPGSLCSLKHDEAVGRKRDHSVTLKLGKIFVVFYTAHPIYVCGFLVSSQDIKKIQFTYLRHHIANRFKEFNWQTSGWPRIYSEITGDILLQGKNKPPLEAHPPVWMLSAPGTQRLGYHGPAQEASWN